jgi:hypothetical protein
MARWDDGATPMSYLTKLIFDMAKLTILFLTRSERREMHRVEATDFYARFISYRIEARVCGCTISFW